MFATDVEAAQPDRAVQSDAGNPRGWVCTHNTWQVYPVV